MSLWLVKKMYPLASAWCLALSKAELANAAKAFEPTTQEHVIKNNVGAMIAAILVFGAMLTPFRIFAAYRGLTACPCRKPTFLNSAGKS
jgi:hypothetical protein